MSDDYDIDYAADSDSPTIPDSPLPVALPAPGGPVLVDYTGPAALAFSVGGSTVTLLPGLNLVAAATWSACSGHKLVVDKLIEPVTLADYAGESLVALVERTRSLDALLMLAAIENDKPVTAGPGKRRDPKVVAALERQIAKAEKAAKRRAVKDQ